MKTNPWPAVALVAVVVAGVLALSALHVDVTVVTALLPLLLAAVAYVVQQLNTIRHQTNGNVSALMDQIRALQDALAQSMPVSALPPAQLPPGTQADSQAPSPAGPVTVDYTPDSQ